MVEARAWAPPQANAEEVAATKSAIAAIAAQVRVIMEPPVQKALALGQPDRKARPVQAAAVPAKTAQIGLRP
jgi:hypothetical protein